LGLDTARFSAMLEKGAPVFQEVFLSQPNRPAALSHFDNMVKQMHRERIRELVELKQNGGKVVGMFCVYVPEEFVLAAGGACVGLCGGSPATIPDAEEELPRTLCPLVKSAYGFKLSRTCTYFQVADLVVGETTCDGKKKTWELLSRHIPTYVMELPQSKTERDYALWLGELHAFKAKVEEVSGRPVTPENLATAIATTDARRAALQRLYDLRKADPVPISGRDALLVTQLCFTEDPRRFTDAVNTLCEELEARVEQGVGAFPPGTTRLLVAGTPMPFPHWKLHHLAESRGAAIVCEETCTGSRLLTGPTEVCGDGLEAQIEALGRRQLNVHCACFTPNEERVEDLVRLAREYRVDGVIHYALEFCQPYIIETVKVRKALEREGIPLLCLEAGYSPEDTERLAVRVDAFLEMVRGGVEYGRK
jgi:benzoyl-CoA reductase/2-hydroxyglutaryl-CoA dehydratase subunit BcrC/BadD/HgdB